MVLYDFEILAVTFDCFELYILDFVNPDLAADGHVHHCCFEQYGL